MNQPRLERRNYGRGHGYKIDGHKVPGVTTVLKIIAKPALIDWAANTTAEAAIDQWDDLSQLAITERLKQLKQARWAVNKAAIVRGNEIHALAEKLSHGQPVDVPDHLVGPVNAFVRFADKWELEFLGTEAPVANTELHYAGTLDGIATSPRLNDGAPILIDNKTGKGVYDETALQLAAYAACDIWQPNGPESEEPMPKVAGLYVAHILPDDVRLLPVVEEIDRLVLQFRYALALSRWEATAKEDPAIGAAL